ncbi:MULTISPECIES: hypothetical protein [unclassified Microbacterium]|uniref:hypothetical protein n=1 Tax=unclassified Microbacterium TaxID=2609290 RepID=UPI0012FC18FD|nr:hypothetical protein [Microbacterium sp. MAH-37]MVQ41233.1 hypothetical protein [Microbacterium sp. MAH-37]
MAEVPSTRKVQITVPVADTSVIEWLDLQYSASDSFRRLVREAIAREGFVDVANRPVRPPSEPVYVAEIFPADEPAPTAVAAPAAAASAPDVDEPEAPEPDAPAPKAPAQKAPAPKADAASATIDDLLGL